MNPAAAEYPIALNYVEVLIDLPWNEFTSDNFDLKMSDHTHILDRDHSGTGQSKRTYHRIPGGCSSLNGTVKGPIYMSIWPSGSRVKLLLGKSIARPLGRKYVRMFMGGLHG